MHALCGHLDGELRCSGENLAWQDFYRRKREGIMSSTILRDDCLKREKQRKRKRERERERERESVCMCFKVIQHFQLSEIMGCLRFDRSDEA